MGIPAGMLLHRIGYKRTALAAIAVGMAGIAIQFLSARAGSFAIYLIGAFVCGFSLCMLNTVVNPMLNTLGGGGRRGQPADPVRRGLQFDRRHAGSDAGRLSDGRRSGAYARKGDAGLSAGPGDLPGRFYRAVVRPDSGTADAGELLPAGAETLSALLSTFCAGNRRNLSLRGGSRSESRVRPIST